MNKLNIIAFMNAYTQGRSGGDIRFIEVKKRWKNTDITVVTSKNGVLLCRQLGLDIKNYITSEEKLFTNTVITYIKRTIRALLFTYFHHRQTILYATSDFFPDVIPCFFLKKKGVVWVQLIHHAYPHFVKRQGNLITNIGAFYLQKFSFFLIKKKADLVIVASELVKQNIIKEGFLEQKIFVSANGVDIKFIGNISAKEKSYDGVFLGRMVVSKGIFDLLKIWRAVCKKKPRAKLAIIGESQTSIKKQVLKKITQYHLQNNIDLLGYLPSIKTYEILKSSKLFIFPSHEEGFGIVVAEALSCKIPVIAYDLPVYKQIFRNTIVLVPQYDIEKFSSKIIALLADEKQRKNISEKGYRLIQKFDWDLISKQEYERVMNLF